MLTRLYIDNYTCFSSFELRLGPSTLLLGPNGGGKSSLFTCLRAVTDLCVHGAAAAQAFPSATRTRWDTRPQQRVELELARPEGTFQYELVIDHDADPRGALVHRETLTLDGRTLFAYTDGHVHLHRNDGSPGARFPLRGTRSFLPQIEDRPETSLLRAFLDSLRRTWIIKLNAPAMHGLSHGEDEALAPDGSNFASWYRHFSQEAPERLSDLWQLLRPALPGLQSLKLTSAGGGARTLIAAMRANGHSYEVAFDELSDGQRALIALYSLLLGVDLDRACLLLDEPEAHVGLAEVQPWLAELDRRVADGGQVVLISHHPEVIDLLAAGEPLLLDRPDGGPARARPAPFDRAGGLSAAKQIAGGLIDADGRGDAGAARGRAAPRPRPDGPRRAIPAV